MATKNTAKKTERDDDFGVWMFKHGKGKKFAKKLNEEKKQAKAKTGKK